MLLLWLHIEPYGIKEPACNNILYREGLAVALVHLRREVAYVALYIPNALACASFAPKEGNVATVGLRIVCADKA